MSCALKDWYSIWDNDPYKSHFAKYYSTTWKRWMFLNGKAVAQHEAVWPKDEFTQFGTENTGCPVIISTHFAHVRSSTTVV